MKPLLSHYNLHCGEEIVMLTWLFIKLGALIADEEKMNPIDVKV